MIRFQFDKLLDQIGHFYYETGKDAARAQGVRLSPKSGRYKGQEGALVECSSPKLTLRFSDGETASYNYVNVNLLDADGLPIEERVTDMTGRPIYDNAVICYSVAMGRNGHACEIGRVIKINPSGSITAQPIRRNGNAVNPTWTRERTCLSANRMILLPIEDTMITMWLLSDFEVFRAEDQYDAN